MRLLRTTHTPDSMRRMIAAADQRLLMLDYDGCLAPFRAERERAYPYDGVIPLLSRIMRDPRNAVAIITGRRIDDLVPLLDLHPLPDIWGTHGWERRRADGSMDAGSVPPSTEALLLQAYDRLCADGWNSNAERKGASLAVHMRDLPADRRNALARTIDRVAETLCATGELEQHAFDGGVEFRIPGRDKGFAVRRLLEEHPGAVLPTYLGDDLTDEDAFRAVAGAGVGVLVREQYRVTAADIHIIPPDELIAFLELWDTA